MGSSLNNIALQQQHTHRLKDNSFVINELYPDRVHTFAIGDLLNSVVVLMKNAYRKTRWSVYSNSSKIKW